MKFGASQVLRFGTLNGAYSVVTQTEYSDSQITLTDSEQAIVESFFGKSNIHRGNVKSSAGKARKEFRLHRSGQSIPLNLVYPKPDKDELRLYLSEQSGFKPPAGYVWFIYSRDGYLWLGAQSEALWRMESRVDHEDDLYQAAMEIAAAGEPEIAAKLVSSMQYLRNPKLASERFKLSDYKCEVDEKHQLFVSRASGNPFLEAHHLIPVSYSKVLASSNLDIVENIYALCPMCHRAIHHSQCNYTEEIVFKLLKRRDDTVKIFGISPQELLSIYSCEKITK